MSDEYKGAVHGAPSGAKHQSVIDLFRDWARDHENKRIFANQGEITQYQATLSDFIRRAEGVIVAIKGQTLGSSRFSDSISAAEQLIELAKHKRKFFDQSYMTMGRQSNTFAERMTFDDQRMVPKASQLGDVAAKIRELKAHDAALTDLTPSQAWALVAADTKGELNQAANMERCINKLAEYNRLWQTNYGRDDLLRTFEYMKSRTKLATQYRLEKPVGEQQGSQGGTQLYKLLMASGFKNVWETGTSQASNDLTKRGAIEEQMGYGAAVRRTGGKAQDYNDGTSTFDPKDRTGASTLGEMPRYAATIGHAQKSGVATRYGTSYILWKESLRARVTWTPGDSWNSGGVGPQSVKNFIGIDHPEGIFAYAEPDLLRVMMAEATGKDQAFLDQLKHGALAQGGAYIETQIHGDLGWRDVAEVVLDPTLKDLRTISDEFEQFKRDKGYDFRVRTIA